MSDLHKRFGGVQAVAGVDFEVMPGTIVSIIGPNGSGKTTLINLITGVVRPDAGGVCINGQEIAGLRPDQVCRKGVSRTFQNLELFNRMSLLDHLLVGMPSQRATGLIASMLRLPSARAEERTACIRARRIAGAFSEHLPADALDDRADSLSYANRRRLEIARALASEPRLLLLDEPAAGMNAQEGRALMAMLAALRDQGHTIVLVEHDMSIVLGISNRVIALDHGEKIAAGAPHDVIRHPRVVEAYLGG